VNTLAAKLVVGVIIPHTAGVQGYLSHIFLKFALKILRFGEFLGWKTYPCKQKCQLGLINLWSSRINSFHCHSPDLFREILKICKPGYKAASNASRGFTVQTWLNGSRSCLGWSHLSSQGTLVTLGMHVPSVGRCEWWRTANWDYWPGGIDAWSASDYTSTARHLTSTFVLPTTGLGSLSHWDPCGSRAFIHCNMVDWTGLVGLKSDLDHQLASFAVGCKSCPQSDYNVSSGWNVYSFNHCINRRRTVIMHSVQVL